MFIWVALKVECQISKGIVNNYKSMFSNPGLLLELWENDQKLELRENLRRTLSILGPHDMGRSYKEMRGAIFRTGEQNNSAVIQSRNGMPR